MSKTSAEYNRVYRDKRPNTRRPGAPRRVSVVRDRKYLDWLINERCVACLNPLPDDGCDPAHGPVNGMRSKGPDDGAIPLCRHHHIEQHQIGWPLFEQKYEFSRDAIAAEHYARFKQEQK